MLNFGNWNINWRWYSSDIFSLYTLREVQRVLSEDLRIGSQEWAEIYHFKHGEKEDSRERSSICQASMFLGSPSSLLKVWWEWEYGVGELGVVVRDQIMLLQEDGHVLGLRWVSGMGCRVKVLGFMRAEVEWKQISSGRYTLHRLKCGPSQKARSPKIWDD